MEARVEEDQTERSFQESPRKCGGGGGGAAAAAGCVQSAANGCCFDCNICLEFAVDPVVTLCGHLYCWPCMYRWLEVESTTPQQCPVCKATLSETTLVPLYGRGRKSTADKPSSSSSYIDIPRRPSRRTLLAATAAAPNLSLHRRRQRRYGGHPAAARRDDVPPTLFGSASTVAVLPWAFGEDVTAVTPPHSNGYHRGGDAGVGPGRRRQEMLARRSLHRIFVFLFSCTVMCLILF